MRARKPIDGCRRSYDRLAQVEFPCLYRRLRRRIRSALPAGLFAKHRANRAELRKSLGLDGEGDFAGCYVFIEGDSPIYVGISRGVLSRIIQHTSSDSPYSASLALKMVNETRKPKLKRDRASWTPAQTRAFRSKQNYLRNCKVAFIDLDKDDAVPLHLFEVYAAMKLGTGRWNSFRTH
jgi:hypothetical protein